MWPVTRSRNDVSPSRVQGRIFESLLDYCFHWGVESLRTSINLRVKLRLGEMDRRSAELSAISLKLEEMVMQLDRLRKLNGRIEPLRLRKFEPPATGQLRGPNSKRFAASLIPTTRPRRRSSTRNES